MPDFIDPAILLHLQALGMPMGAGSAQGDVGTPPLSNFTDALPYTPQEPNSPEPGSSASASMSFPVSLNQGPGPAEQRYRTFSKGLLDNLQPHLRAVADEFNKATTIGGKPLAELQQDYGTAVTDAQQQMRKTAQDIETIDKARQAASDAYLKKQEDSGLLLDHRYGGYYNSGADVKRDQQLVQELMEPYNANAPESWKREAQAAAERLQKSQSIDPWRILSSPGQKLLGAVAAFVNGFAAGLTHQQPTFMNDLMMAIDRDVEAQKAGAASKVDKYNREMNAWDVAYKHFDDAAQRKTAAMTMVLSNVKLITDEFGAAQASAAITAQLQNMRTQMVNEAGHNGAQAAQIEVERGGQNARLSATLAKKGPGAGIAGLKTPPVPVSPERENKAADLWGTGLAALDSINTLVDLRKHEGVAFNLWSPETKARYVNLTRTVKDSIRKIGGYGAALSPAEAKNLDEAIDDPSRVGFVLDQLQGLYPSLKQDLNAKLTTLYGEIDDNFLRHRHSTSGASQQAAQELGFTPAGK
jgi:hypothetical protein